MSTEHFDVVVVGAGLSGIGAGYHLQTNCLDKSYIILEGREAIGGTWDLFRYPGIRSDSDMYTLGYSFKPWTEAKAIADGPAILKYVRDTATENGIDSRIRFKTRVRQASWDSKEARWTVDAERGDEREPVRYTCNFLFMCSGYYKYENGYTPEFKGADRFKGRIVHPQKWTDDIDYAGKSVVVKWKAPGGKVEKTLRYFRHDNGGGADGALDMTDAFSITSGGKTGYYVVSVETIVDATEKRLKMLEVAP